MTKAGDDLGGAAARRAAKRSAWASRSRSKRLRFASKTLRSGRMWAHRRIRPKRSRTACLADRTASCARSSCHRPSSRTPTAAPRRQYLAESADSSIQRLRAVTKARARPVASPYRGHTARRSRSVAPTRRSVPLRAMPRPGRRRSAAGWEMGAGRDPARRAGAEPAQARAPQGVYRKPNLRRRRHGDPGHSPSVIPIPVPRGHPPPRLRDQRPTTTPQPWRAYVTQQAAFLAPGSPSPGRLQLGRARAGRTADRRPGPGGDLPPRWPKQADRDQSRGGGGACARCAAPGVAARGCPWQTEHRNKPPAPKHSVRALAAVRPVLPRRRLASPLCRGSCR